jgi:hypothetical protein
MVLWVGRRRPAQVRRPEQGEHRARSACAGGGHVPNKVNTARVQRALAEGTRRSGVLPPEDLLTLARRPTGFGFAMAFVFYNGGPILLRSESG